MIIDGYDGDVSAYILRHPHFNMLLCKFMFPTTATQISESTCRGKKISTQFSMFTWILKYAIVCNIFGI